jgi:hypothetical protein
MQWLLTLDQFRKGHVEKLAQGLDLWQNNGAPSAWF